jgi:hypothetical protein
MCSINELSELNLSNNAKLETLNCGNNSMLYLDVSKNTELIEIFASFNTLIALDVSHNVRLKTLRCDNNKLTILDVSKNTQLAQLQAYVNPQLKVVYIWQGCNPPSSWNVGNAQYEVKVE